MKKIFKNINITRILFILFSIFVLLFWFNVLSLNFTGIICLILLFLFAILSASKIVEFPKKKLFCLLISLFIIFIILVTHFVIIKKPFIYYYEKTDSGIQITGYRKRILNNYGDFYIEIPSTYKGEKITKIKEKAFFGSQDLFNITIPDTVVEIEKEAFSNSSLRYVTLSNNLKNIEDEAFSNTMIDYVMIPSSVNYIGKNVFSKTDIIVLESNNINDNWDENWNNKNSRIYYNACHIISNNGVLYVLYNDYTSAVIDIAKFSYSKIELLDKITFNNKEYIVDTIESYAGYNTTFEEIEIPNSIVKICSNAIKNEKLKKIFIPISVLYMDEQVFVGCNNLTISTEHLEKPLNWDENWNLENRVVEWNINNHN